MYYYALTLRKTRQPIEYLHYEMYVEKLLKKLKNTIEVIEAHYETTQGLHYHAMVASLYKLRPKDLRLEKYGWSFQCNEVTHYDGWMNYIRKDITKQKEHLRMFLLTEDDQIPSHLSIPERIEYAKKVIGYRDDVSEDDTEAWYRKVRLV